MKTFVVGFINLQRSDKIEFIEVDEANHWSAAWSVLRRYSTPTKAMQNSQTYPDLVEASALSDIYVAVTEGRLA